MANRKVDNSSRQPTTQTKVTIDKKKWKDKSAVNPVEINGRRDETEKKRAKKRGRVMILLKKRIRFWKKKKLWWEELNRIENSDKNL